MFRGNLYRLIDVLSTIKGSESIYTTYGYLKKISKYDEKKIDEIRFKKIKTMLNHAVKNIYYYKNLFKENNIRLSDITKIEDLCKIPVLTKKNIRENYPDKIVDQNIVNRSIYNTTSGSTGEPMEFYMDRNSNPYAISSFMFFNTVMGVKEFDVHWNIKNLGSSMFKQQIIYWIVGKHVYSVSDLNEENIPEIVRQINKIKPNYLEGYSSSLHKLSYMIENQDEKLTHHPKAVIATSETLTQLGRQSMEHVFQTEVFDRYGHREFGAAVAQECKQHDGFHINPICTHIDIVDKNGESVDEGEEGRILITDLNNMVMPFIRYEVGDLGSKGGSDCPCGLHFPILNSLNGRTGDFLTSPTGNTIPLLALSGPIHKNFSPFLYAYQFVQRKNGKVLMKIVSSSKYTRETGSALFNKIQNILVDFEIEIELVDDIPSEPNGKTKLLKYE